MAKEKIINSQGSFVADSGKRVATAGKNALLFEIVQGSINTSHYIEICNQVALGTTTTGVVGVNMKRVEFATPMPLVFGKGGFTTTTSIMWNAKIINGPTTLVQMFFHSNSYDTSKLYYTRLLVAGKDV
jgi:hypothetical protein